MSHNPRIPLKIKIRTRPWDQWKEINKATFQGSRNMPSKEKWPEKECQLICCLQPRRMKAKVDSPQVKELHHGNIPKTLETKQPKKSLLPLTVDQFTFHHSLGQGYIGKVMFATDCVRKECVAIKSVQKRALLRMSNGLVERKVLQLACKNIFLVPGYGAFHTQNYIYYVMELVGGGTLHEYLTKVPILKWYSAQKFCM